MALKQVKNQILATKKTGQVTKAMESVSAVKMRKSQERAFVSRPYVHAAMRILAQLATSQEGLAHPLAQPGVGEKELLIVVTSDKGLAGSVNSSVLKKVEEHVYASSGQQCDVVAIGRKALEFAGRSKLAVLSEYTNVSDDVSITDVAEMAAVAVHGFREGTYSSVKVVYQNFLSTFEQEPVVRKLLPFQSEAIHETLRGIRPKRGKFSDDVLEADRRTVYTIEPSPEAVLGVLIPQLVEIMVFHALLESKASEHSARMVAMKNATDKSKDVVKALTIKYNKARQAAITAEVSEITAGAEAMK